MIWYILAFITEIVLSFISVWYLHPYPTTFYSIIFFSFLAGVIFCSYRALRSIYKLNTFSKRSIKEFFSEIKKDNSDFSFIRNKKIENICTAYKETFIKSPSPYYYKTRSNSDLYFGSDAWLLDIHKTPLLLFLKIIPSIFIGLGILGTFIGFANGIQTLDYSDADRLLKGVGLLIAGLKTAFNTSIAWVIGSIYMNFFIINPILNKIDKLAKRLCDDIDKEFYITEVEALNITDSDDNEIPFSTVMLTITRKLDNMNESITQMGNSIGENLAQGISSSIDKIIADTINVQINALSQKLEESVRGLSFAQTTFQNIPDEIKQSTEHLESACKNISNIQNTIIETQNNFEKNIKQIASVLQDSANNLNLIFTENAKSMSSTFTSGVQNINTSIDKALEFQDEVTNVSAQIFQKSLELKEALDAANKLSYEKSNDLIESISNMNNTKATELAQVIGNLQAVLESSQKANKNTQDLLKTFTGLDIEIANAFNKIQGNLQKYTSVIDNSLSNNLDNFSNTMQKTFAQFFDTVALLEEILDKKGGNK